MTGAPDNNGENTGKFQKGNRGRPRGAKNKLGRLTHKLLAQNAEALMQKCIELALNGDVKALALCLERCHPARRGGLTTFALPASLRTAEEIDEAAASVLRACSDGRLTVDECAVLTKSLRDRGETLAIKEIRRDLDNLIAARPWVKVVR
jgi:hypothetical protein